MEPRQPIAVTCLASSEAIDALPGAEGGSPRVVPDESKPAVTDCAARGRAMSGIFRAVGHWCLLWLYTSRSSIILLSLHPASFTFALPESSRFSDACILGQSRSTAQLTESRGRSSKGVTELYVGLGRPPLSCSRCEACWGARRDHELLTRWRCLAVLRSARAGRARQCVVCRCPGYQACTSEDDGLRRGSPNAPDSARRAS